MSEKSKWVTIRDSVLDSLKFDKVTEDMKSGLTRWLLSELLPVAKKAAESFCTQTKEQATKEAGWCKVRDLIVLPFIIQGGVWLIEQALNKTVEVQAE